MSFNGVSWRMDGEEWDRPASRAVFPSRRAPESSGFEVSKAWRRTWKGCSGAPIEHCANNKSTTTWQENCKIRARSRKQNSSYLAREGRLGEPPFAFFCTIQWTMAEGKVSMRFQSDDQIIRFAVGYDDGRDFDAQYRIDQVGKYLLPNLVCWLLALSITRFNGISSTRLSRLPDIDRRFTKSRKFVPWTCLVNVSQIGQNHGQIRPNRLDGVTEYPQKLTWVSLHTKASLQWCGSFFTLRGPMVVVIHTILAKDA